MTFLMAFHKPSHFSKTDITGGGIEVTCSARIYLKLPTKEQLCGMLIAICLSSVYPNAMNGE